MTRLTLALPSKGRLKENTEDWLESAGFKLRQIGGARGYQAELDGLGECDVLLLSAREIAEGLLSGRLHLGVTGEDLLHDLASDQDAQVHIIRRLGFGFANMVVAVPDAWIDVTHISDLDAVGAQFRARHGRRLRVATKYLNSTRKFFAANSVGEYRLVDSAGATEAAPASGTADLIVDITTTGATLIANGLKILEDGSILKSQAALTGSLRADWSDSARASLRTLLDGVEARAAAQGLKRLVAHKDIPAKMSAKLGLLEPVGRSGHCAARDVQVSATALCDAGLGPVIVQDIDVIFRATNEVYDSFVKKF